MGSHALYPHLSRAAAYKRARKEGLVVSHRVQWTPEMDARLIELRAGGMGWNRLARIVGVAPITAQRRGEALGLSPPAARALSA